MEPMQLDAKYARWALAKKKHRPHFSYFLIAYGQLSLPLQATLSPFLHP
jgi:hypothetical protein